MFLPDANVLLYAVNSDDPHHEESRSWIEATLAAGLPLALCWATVFAFIRISTRSGIFPRPLTVGEAVELVEAWRAHPASLLLVPTTRHIAIVHGLLGSSRLGGNIASDAHLAALAMEYGAEIVTYDNDFARFEGIVYRRPGS